MTTPQISDSELELMKIVWSAGGGTALYAQIMEALAGAGRTWQKNTVITLLSRLVDKGFLTVCKLGRRNEYAFRVAGTLFRAEFVGPVRSAYRDGERIHARFGDEVHHLVGFGVGVVLGRYLVLDAGQHAEFAFHRYVRSEERRVGKECGS